MAEGRGGVVKQFLATPPRLRELEVASQLFLNRASAQTFKASPQFGQLCLTRGDMPIVFLRQRKEHLI